VGFVITAILVVNNYRDIETDAAVGKRSLAVILGPEKTRMEFKLLIALTYAMPIFLTAAGAISLWAALFPMLSLPLALACIREMNTLTGRPPLNQTLAKTAKLSLLFSLLLAAGLVC
jgi:1,4-dihydroxy-2-naphthoate octaprenyltransferase